MSLSAPIEAKPQPWCKLSLIDYIFLFLIAIPIAYGLYKGIVRMIVSTLAIFLGFLFARQYSDSFVAALEGWIHIGRIGKYVAFIICFFVIALLISIIGRIVRKGVQGANLGCIDRLLGACMGGVLGLGLSFGLIFLIFSIYKQPELSPLKDSRLSPAIVETGTYFLLMIPPWMEEGIQEEYDRLRDLWKKGKDKEGSDVAVLST
jgi:membrane protein required for colicin V production